MAKKLYLIVVEGDVEPRIEGPFRNEDARVLVARRLHAEDPLTRGVFPLDVPEKGVPETWAYRSDYLEKVEG